MVIFEIKDTLYVCVWARMHVCVYVCENWQWDAGVIRNMKWSVCSLFLLPVVQVVFLLLTLPIKILTRPCCWWTRDCGNVCSATLFVSNTGCLLLTSHSYSKSILWKNAE